MKMWHLTVGCVLGTAAGVAVWICILYVAGKLLLHGN